MPRGVCYEEVDDLERKRLAVDLVVFEAVRVREYVEEEVQESLVHVGHYVGVVAQVFDHVQAHVHDVVVVHVLQNRVGHELRYAAGVPRCAVRICLKHADGEVVF